MSFLDQETVPLLGDSRAASLESSRDGSNDRRFRHSPETLLIPVALTTRLASLIPSTTFIELVRQAVCKLWNTSHRDLATLSAGGPIPPELCDAPEIQRYFSIAMAILGVIEGITTMAACGGMSRISSYYGRKPALLFALIAGIMGNCFIPGSRFTPDWLADWVFIAGILFTQFSGIAVYTYLINVYIVDICTPEDRTAALGKITGWAMLGACISFALGGSITTQTGNPLIVFYLAAAIFVATLIYILSVLPESFPEEKRRALYSMYQDHTTDWFTTKFLFILDPLKMLIPTRKLDGTRNWRLVWCAVHVFVFTTANSYAPVAWVVLATSKYHFTPLDTGLFLTIVTISCMIILVVILPPLVRSLRPYYSQRAVSTFLEQEDVSIGEELKSETSDHLDVHLAFVACLITGIFYLSAAASTTIPAMIFSAIFVGFAYVHTPTVRSLAAGSVDPLKQGEALAAIEMVSNAAGALSPVIMGSILTATINTAPLFLFYVHLVVVATSGGLLFLVRDADKYREPHET